MLPVREPIRLVLVHYHFFKNAGTSVDEVLKRNLRERWREAEFVVDPKIRSNRALVEQWLGENPSILALSSHSATLQLPVLANTIVFPIVFLRHPLDRLRSMYEFERRQSRTSPETDLAKSASFAEYIEAFLNSDEASGIVQDGRASNQQTNQLSRLVDGGKSKLFRSMTALQRLPLVGVVEAFQPSMQRLENSLRRLGLKGFRAFPVHANRVQPVEALEVRLSRMRYELGPSLFRDLVERNHDDLAICRVAAASYGMGDSPSLSFRALREGL